MQDKQKRNAKEEEVEEQKAKEENEEEESGRKRKQRDAKWENSKKLQAGLRVLLYPLAFTIVWIPPMINRFYEGWDRPLFALALLQAIAESSLGTADALVYLVTMRSTLWRALRYRKKPKYLGDDGFNELTFDHTELKDSKIGRAHV